MIAGTGAEHHRFAPVLALFGLVKTAAKRRRGLGTMSPSGFGRQPNVTPKNKREVVSEQNAKHSAIETGLKRKTRISQPINIESTVKTAAKRRRGLGGSPTSSPVLRISRTLKNQPRQDAEADKDG